MKQTQTFDNEIKQIKTKNSCPKCDFSGNKEFPNGYVKEGNGSYHCPKCGYWGE